MYTLSEIHSTRKVSLLYVQMKSHRYVEFFFCNTKNFVPKSRDCEPGSRTRDVQ